FQDANLILMILSSLIVVVLTGYYFTMKDNNLLIRIGLAVAMGGALGNLVDRVTQGYVTDFLSFGRFPIFNVGDSAVTVGVGLMVLALLLESRHTKPVDEIETAIKDENG
ncbi:MAG TPA: signal peptidase II, partial [Anaerolineaceae bacterium]|nr:signal peptidase II [Anaerolineaceae bacterium]